MKISENDRGGELRREIKELRGFRKDKASYLNLKVASKRYLLKKSIFLDI